MDYFRKIENLSKEDLEKLYNEVSIQNGYEQKIVRGCSYCYWEYAGGGCDRNCRYGDYSCYGRTSGSVIDHYCD